MKLIVGLGNPGKKYAKTRHNVGFMILDHIQKTQKDDVSEFKKSSKFNAEIAEGRHGDDKILLAKPMTFMNDSGQSVQLIKQYYKIDPTDIIVVHDDKDIMIGEIKVHTDRGDAGHNGIKSIIEHIGTKKFTRIRVGVKNQNARAMNDTAQFVLNKFSLFEKKVVRRIIEDATSRVLNEI